MVAKNHLPLFQWESEITNFSKVNQTLETYSVVIIRLRIDQIASSPASSTDITNPNSSMSDALLHFYLSGRFTTIRQ